MANDWTICGRCYNEFPKRPGKGRPRLYCDACRDTKHDAAHDKFRRATIAAAYGTPCVRCGEDLTYGNPLGEPELDHADDGIGYLGYSHRHCNRSAGATKGNLTPSPAKAAQQARWASTHPPSRSPSPSRPPTGPRTPTATPSATRPPMPDDGFWAWCEVPGFVGWQPISREWK